MAEYVYLDRYNRHCLDKLLGTDTEAALKEVGHIFTLVDGTEYTHSEGKIIIGEEEPPPVIP